MSQNTSSSSLLSNRFVRVIVASSFLLQIGIWVRNFAILLFVMDQTGNNPIAVSLISIAEYVPIFLFSFIGGTFADRWRPKNTMVWCDFLSALSVFLVLLTIIYGTWKAVFLVTFISAILSQFSQPSGMKLVKFHVPAEQLQTAMAMYQTLSAIFMIIGPVLGTIVYQKFGIYIGIAIMGVAFLLSAAVLSFLPPDQKPASQPAEANFWGELIDGFRYVWRKKVLATIGGVYLVAGLAVGITQPLGVFLIVERLGLPKESLQWLLADFGAAMLIGGAMVMGLAQKIKPQKLLALGLLTNAICIMGMGFSTSWPLTLLFQFFNGLVMPCIQIGVSTLTLKITEQEYVGRVNGVLTPLFIGAMVITMSIAGWFKVQFSLASAYSVSGMMFFLGLLLTLLLFKADLTAEEKVMVEESR